MSVFQWTGFSILWVAVGITTIVWFSRRCSFTTVLRIGLPAFTTATMLILLRASPAGSPLPGILHHAGFTLLGVFLLMTEILRAQLRHLRSGQTFEVESLSLCKCFRTATALCAPPAAIVILLSGWRLMLDFEWSLRTPWLWWVYVLFAVMMWHGTFHWRSQVKRLAAGAENGRAHLSPGADRMMTAHGVLFLLIFAIAFDQGTTPLPHPCPETIATLENALGFLPSTWRSVGISIGVWLAVGLLTGTEFKLRQRGR